MSYLTTCCVRTLQLQCSNMVKHKELIVFNPAVKFEDYSGGKHVIEVKG